MTAELVEVVRKINCGPHQECDEQHSCACRDIAAATSAFLIGDKQRGWLSIDTAPKDGTAFLAANSRHSSHAPVAVRWSGDETEPHWCDAATPEGSALYYNPNYFDLWMPCPPLSSPPPPSDTDYDREAVNRAFVSGVDRDVDVLGQAASRIAPSDTGERNGLCSDCPPIGYETDRTRCEPCPRRALTGG